MTNLLTPSEAAQFVRTDPGDTVVTMLLPLVDGYIQRATGRDWTQDATINAVAKAAAGMLLVGWYDNPGQIGNDGSLPFGLMSALAQLEAEALKYRQYTFAGASSAGSIAIPGARIADEVISLVGVYGVSGDQHAHFASVIDLDGCLSQLTNSDYSDYLFTVVLKSPMDDVVA